MDSDQIQDRIDELEGFISSYQDRIFDAEAEIEELRAELALLEPIS